AGRAIARSRTPRRASPPIKDSSVTAHRCCCRRNSMDLTWTEDEEAFRAEARGWLESHLAEWHDRIGGRPLSGDTREGFDQHLVWEHMLFEDKWAVVSWPSQYGGREASLWEWLIFEE